MQNWAFFHFLIILNLDVYPAASQYSALFCSHSPLLLYLKNYQCPLVITKTTDRISILFQFHLLPFIFHFLTLKHMLAFISLSSPSEMLPLKKF